MLTHPRSVVGILLAGALVASACGSSSGGTSTTAAQDSGAYRASVNALFDAIISARGDYESGQGGAELRAAARTLQHADEQALAQVRALHAPSGATKLHAQLAAAIAAQAKAVGAVLAASRFDTGRLGDAERRSFAIEQAVNQINALP